MRDIPDSIELWPTDIELIDFLLNYPRDRVLQLVGPRGAGKTSLLHFTEGVLLNSGFALPPLMLIIDGNSLGPETTRETFAERLITKLRSRIEVIPETYRQSFSRALSVLEGSPHLGTAERMQLAMRELVEFLPGKNPRLISLVFDNLDHHHTELVSLALQIAKELHLASGVGAVLCVRESTMRHMLRSDTARAFIRYAIDVRTPQIDKWLANISQRILYAAGLANDLPVVRGVEMTPQHVAVAFKRFGDLLYGKRAGDSPIALLEAVSANDTRHLARLLRRILSNPGLPDEWLLDLGATDTPPPFHPLSSIINGDASMYTHSPDVPNLLCVTDAEGNDDFLLSHRLLTMLDASRTQVPFARLTSWLEELRYTKSSVIGCIQMLIAAHLVECSDTDVIDSYVDDQWSFVITEAGQYYLHRLLRTGDYLALVIVDVPLEHAAFHSVHADTFVARIHSLLEYGDAIREREERQVYSLVKDRPASAALRRVADTLQRGGLFLPTFADGVEQILERSRHSRSQAVSGTAEDSFKRIARWRSWAEGAQLRLRDVVNRSRKATPPPEHKVHRRHGSTEVTLSFETIGDDVECHVRVSVPPGQEDMLVSIRCEFQGETVSGAAAIALATTPKRLSGESLITNLPIRASGPMTSITADNVDVQLLSLPQTADRVGLLSANVTGEDVEIQLHTSVGHGAKASELGRCRRRDLLDWSARELQRLGGVVATGGNVDEAVRVSGTTFAKKFLSPSGANLLASHYELLDSLIISCQDPEVPWELLCPPPDGGDLLPAIGEQWRIVRWPTDVQALGLRATLSDFSRGSGRINTIGVQPDESMPWRVGIPRQMTELVAAAKACDTLHIIGHWDGESVVFDRGQWRLDAATLAAYSLRGPACVVLSACGAGSAERHHNLPIQLSMGGECVAFSPLVTIREQDAARIDELLSRFAHDAPDEPVEAFFRHARETEPVLRLYARYGLRAEPR